jgi:hypothetical protein
MTMNENSAPVPDPALGHAQRAAFRFVADDAGFAQVVSVDRRGQLVGRSMTAFLNENWSVDLLQRRQHARLTQWRRNPHTVVTWVGTPAVGATNEHPHVFDINTLPPRAVFVRGTVTFLDPALTEQIYRREIEAQRAAGFDKAPLRSPDEVARDLEGVRLIPYRVRLEGFGKEAQAFDFTINETGGSQ